LSGETILAVRRNLPILLGRPVCRGEDRQALKRKTLKPLKVKCVSNQPGLWKKIELRSAAEWSVKNKGYKL